MFLSSLNASIEPGIVRGIDTFKGLLYLISPVPPILLEKVDLLLQGFIHIPTCLLQVIDPCSASLYVSYTVLVCFVTVSLSFVNFLSPLHLFSCGLLVCFNAIEVNSSLSSSH